jgi:hypothetical protein
VKSCKPSNARDSPEEERDVWELENEEIVAAVFRHLGPGE